VNNWQTRRSGHAKLAVFASALSMLVAACSGASEPAAGSTPSGEPQRGGRIVIGIADESTLGFDPSTSAVGPGGRTIALAIFDTITAFDADGNLVPYLAESVEPNADATTWTVVLREGITFHDGTPLNAEAVKSTFDAHDAADRPLAPGYTTKAVDDLTVEFTFPEPYGTFEAAMATQFGWIKSPTAEESLGEEFTNNPVGTGPYMLEEWVRDDHLTLVRYEDHWRDDLSLLDEV
jgi:peptide/nickel transport system substrate-binding protein